MPPTTPVAALQRSLGRSILRRVSAAVLVLGLAGMVAGFTAACMLGASALGTTMVAVGCLSGLGAVLDAVVVNAAFDNEGPLLWRPRDWGMNGLLG